MVADILTTALLLIGAAFMLLSALGTLRMPDLYTRLQTTSKAATLGIGFILLAAIIHFPRLGTASRTLLILAFIVVTAPIAAHMIARAAYVSGEPLEENAVQDDLRGRELEAEAAAKQDTLLETDDTL